mmetsp:Transcript_12256/g.17050  ORF Transcript_12256/g.17050 Transcript_12256/m.17050 type:complete len:307 (+) Transcript_12256:103-1023(+)|eukprot:CAMPEP_0184486162 /NCGR_PEP_ID=MMETSP0113_2-20130426/7699_1 /TAXON_ID=91329 /ORGANISM="Norrisiella sphaerica, Strain BC52" /LENGTH=306 /DNA_ID=CAMNT_0026867909 /DNA_START=103 /DNA_END=1023 /DNA_ORIENTATION=-
MIWILFNLLWVSRGLIIYNEEQGIYEQLNHYTADFGAAEPYNIYGEIVLPEEPLMCQINSNTAFLEGSIALLLRGNCSFYLKALNAQNQGAQAVIIGDSQQRNRPLRMIKEGPFEDPVEIPVVAITHSDYVMIAEFLNKNVTIEAHMNINGDLSPRLPVFHILPLVFILVWMGIIMLYFCRKYCMRYISRQNRVSAMREVPVVRYEPLVEDEEAEAEAEAAPENRNRVLNSRCVICMEDYVEGEELKLLPCGHGFHPPCIQPWLENHSERCPMCNRSMLENRQEGAGRDGSPESGNSVELKENLRV